jgi:hypothetical protein
MSRRLLVPILIASQWALQPPLSRGDELLDSIDRSWRARGEKVTSVRAQWKMTTTFLKGGLTFEARLTAIPNSEFAARLKNGAQVPEEDVSVESRHQLAILRARAGYDTLARYDYETIAWSMRPEPKYEVKPRKALSLDGATKVVDPNGLGVGAAPVGGMRKEQFLSELMEPQAFPLTLHCLPYSRWYFTHSIRNLGTIASKPLDGGLVELTCHRDKTSYTIRLLCDRNRGDVITSIEQTDDKTGKPTVSYSIEYQPDPVLGVFPKRWQATQYAQNEPGKATRRITAVVESYEVNPPIDRSDLEFEFEKGTLLFGAGPTGKQLVGANGERYNVTDADMARGYEGLRKLADPQPSVWRRPVIIAPAAAVLFLAGGSFVILRRRARKKREGAGPEQAPARAQP